MDLVYLADWDDQEEARAVARHLAFDTEPADLDEADPAPVRSLTRPEYADRGHAADTVEELRREQFAPGDDAA